MTQPKPVFWTEEYATAWQHPAVADAYQYRPPYPAETFTTLSKLIVDSPRNVLDLGCGTGGLARYLIPSADRIDAVDISLAMIQRAKQLPHGTNPKLLTVQGSYETPPNTYSQSLAAYVESFHARSSLAHGRLDPAQSAAFDQELCELVGKSDADEVETQVTAKIVWGKPHARISSQK